MNSDAGDVRDPVDNDLIVSSPVLYMVAQDEASLQAYGPSATHMDYVKEITPLVEKAFIADFPVDRVAYNLVHIVNFNVAPGKEEDWKTGAGHLIASSKAGSGILPIDIIYAGAMVGAHNTGVNHVLYTEFEKKADLDVYGPHDAHQHAVVNFLRPSSASPAVVFDFEAGPAPQ